MADHRKHRNILYGLVILLALIQISSFVILSIQVVKVNAKTDSSISSLSSQIDSLTKQAEANDEFYQQSLNELSTTLAQQQSQQEDFQQEIKLIKSYQSDFSAVVEDSVKSVVTVSTANTLGSGFIISEDGYIVTNYHVLEGQRANSLRVITYDKEVLAADFIGADDIKDLALIKIEAFDLDRFELADSDNLQVGQRVIAIGNPLGLSFTVTEGIISAVDRTGPSGLNEYVQTDVSLNPGNSGGPLINTAGEVVGINNFKIGDAESLGFALESNAIRETINEIANVTIIS